MDRQTLFLFLVQTEALNEEMRPRWPFQQHRGYAGAVVANAADIPIDTVEGDLHQAARNYVAYCYGRSPQRPPFARTGPLPGTPGTGQR